MKKQAFSLWPLPPAFLGTGGEGVCVWLLLLLFLFAAFLFFVCFPWLGSKTTMAWITHRTSSQRSFLSSSHIVKGKLDSWVLFQGKKDNSWLQKNICSSGSLWMSLWRQAPSRSALASMPPPHCLSLMGWDSSLTSRRSNCFLGRSQPEKILRQQRLFVCLISPAACEEWKDGSGRVIFTASGVSECRCFWVLAWRERWEKKFSLMLTLGPFLLFLPFLPPSSDWLAIYWWLKTQKMVMLVLLEWAEWVFWRGLEKQTAKETTNCSPSQECVLTLFISKL